LVAFILVIFAGIIETAAHSSICSSGFCLTY
jgi:hypothetical protein